MTIIKNIIELKNNNKIKIEICNTIGVMRRVPAVLSSHWHTFYDSSIQSVVYD